MPSKPNQPPDHLPFRKPPRTPTTIEEDDDIDNRYVHGAIGQSGELPYVNIFIPHNGRDNDTLVAVDEYGEQVGPVIFYFPTDEDRQSSALIPVAEESTEDEEPTVEDEAPPTAQEQGERPAILDTIDRVFGG